MTYMLNAKQFIVVATGGSNQPAEPIALRLPDTSGLSYLAGGEHEPLRKAQAR
jgi:hypothetical protein